MANASPWIHELDKERKVTPLARDEITNVAVVGAGIAGVSTAFFILKHTNKKVVVVERDKLAHGATGHNAGFVAAALERPLTSLVEEYGLETASEGLRDIEESWALIDMFYSEAGLTLPFYRTASHHGLATEEQVLRELEDAWWRKQGKLPLHKIFISEEAEFLSHIPPKYQELFFVVPVEEIVVRLQTFDPQYQAVVSSSAGVMNSALFCEQVMDYLLERYKERIQLYEQTTIKKVVLKENKVLLDAEMNTIECDEVVLCTNGFENFEILAPGGLAINTRFHHEINGVVAFMSGFFEELKDAPATAYFSQGDESGLTDNPGEPYFYVSRRPYEYEPNTHRNLICVGGPDQALEDRAKYSRHESYPKRAYELIDGFVRRTYDKKDLEYAFHWHGVMGYTTNLLRMVGPDPEYDRLLYNLGCNGVGILPSIYGGEKVARIISGEKFKKSIFDIPPRLVESEGEVVTVLKEAALPD